MMGSAQENDSNYLPKTFCIQAFLVIIDEALNQLYLIRKFYNRPETSTNMQDFMYKTLEERFNETGVQNSDPAHNCTIAESVLSFLKDELTICGAFDNFTAIVNGFVKMQNDDTELLAKAVEKDTELKKLEEIFYDERIQFCRKIEKCMSEIGKLKDSIEDFTVEEKVKHNYVRQWQNSKLEMHDIVNHMKEYEKTEGLKLINLEIGREMRVNEEIMLAYTEFQNDLCEKLEEWKNRYAEDLKSITDKITELQGEYNQQESKITQLEALYSKREKQMNDYKQYKIEQERKREELERKNLAATRIQAWWRGTMVRKGFGKFRKKKEKKGKKKSSDKKPTKSTQ